MAGCTCLPVYAPVRYINIDQHLIPIEFLIRSLRQTRRNTLKRIVHDFRFAIKTKMSVGFPLILSVILFLVLCACPLTECSSYLEGRHKICGFQSFTNNIYNACFIRRRRRDVAPNRFRRSISKFSEDGVADDLQSLSSVRSDMMTLIRDLYKQCCTVGCDATQLSTICYFMFSSRRK
ncbi:Uncharacterised protein g6955 [Pycnogonum litorale]